LPNYHRRDTLAGGHAASLSREFLPLRVPAMTCVRVDLGLRGYDIEIRHEAPASDFARFARTCLDATWAGRGSRSALIVTDENVDGLSRPYAEALEAIGLRTVSAVVAPGEASKSLDQAARLYERLAGAKADRHTCVVGVGGGVVGDLAGFVAATYARGLPLLMIPTSLLAQVDSSVGGKVGVNHPSAKNLIGAFHQPVGVWIDLGHLKSLPDRERRCGLAEVVKHGMILDPEFFGFLEANAGLLGRGDSGSTRHAIARSCELKAGVVSADEYEQTGVRAILNFGHTVGHAVEAVAGYGGGYQHGEAVAVGMVAEARLAERMGKINPEAVDRLAGLLVRLGLPVAAPGLSVEALLAAMTLDKKNRGGQVRFVLPDRIGSVAEAEAPAELVREVVEATVA